MHAYDYADEMEDELGAEPSTRIMEADRQIYPSWAALELVRAARAGNEQAQQKIADVLVLARSEYPHAPIAQAAERNLLRAAWMENRGYGPEDQLSRNIISKMLDREIAGMERNGVVIGVGVWPWVVGALGVVLAYILLKPSRAGAVVKPPAPGTPATVHPSSEAAQIITASTKGLADIWKAIASDSSTPSTPTPDFSSATPDILRS